MRVLAVVTDVGWRAHLHHALADGYVVTCVAHAGIRDGWTTEWTADAVIIHLDSRALTADRLTVVLQRIRRWCPRAIIVAYGPFQATVCGLIASAARGTIDRIVFRGQDAVAATIEDAVAGGQSPDLVGDILRALGPLTVRARATVSYCLLRAFHVVLTAARLADELAVHRKTLFNQVRTDGLPAPAALITWTRLLVAARLLDDGARSVADVARVLHFVSPSQYRGMLARYTRLTPTELRARGALATMCAQFTRARIVVEAAPAARRPASAYVTTIAHWMTGDAPLGD